VSSHCCLRAALGVGDRFGVREPAVAKPGATHAVRNRNSETGVPEDPASNAPDKMVWTPRMVLLATGLVGRVGLAGADPGQLADPGPARGGATAAVLIARDNRPAPGPVPPPPGSARHRLPLASSHTGAVAGREAHCMSPATDRTRPWAGRADLGRAAAGHDPDGRRASGQGGRRPGGGHAGGDLPHARRTAAAADPRGPCRRRPGRPAGPVATAMPAATMTCARSPRPPAAELPGPHLP
jgi:hypothetical protein